MIIRNHRMTPIIEAPGEISSRLFEQILNPYGWNRLCKARTGWKLQQEQVQPCTRSETFDSRAIHVVNPFINIVEVKSLLHKDDTAVASRHDIERTLIGLPLLPQRVSSRQRFGAGPARLAAKTPELIDPMLPVSATVS